MLQSLRKSAWRRSALLTVAAVLVMTMLAACGGGNKEEAEGHSLEFRNVSGGEVVATYNGGQITKDEFDKYLTLFGISQPMYEQIIEIPQFQEIILEQYVSYKVLGAEASEATLEEARKEVDEQLTYYEQAVNSDADLAAKVKEKNVTNEDMATFFMLNATIVGHINSLVTEEDITKAIEASPADYTVSSVRHVLVQTVEYNQSTGESKEVRSDEDALARANEVKAKLDAGGDWDALAKEYSDDPGSKDKGGLYEDAMGKNWVEPFKIATYEQEIGVIGEPVKSDFGYHVIQVDKREAKTFDQFSDTEKEQVKSELAMERMEKFMSEEMPKLDLKITLPQPEPTEGDDAAGDESEADGDAEGAEEEAPAAN